MLGRYRPNLFGADIGPLFLGLCLAQSSGPAQPTCFNNIYLINNIILYISFKKKTKNSKKISKILWKKLWFSQIFFLPILHNIGLYIYTVKYKSCIKIPGFLWNISKKRKLKHSQKEKIFYCIRPNPKIFPSIFFI